MKQIEKFIVIYILAALSVYSSAYAATLNEVETLFKNGDYAQALNQSREIINQDNNYYITVGRINFKLEQYNEAAEGFVQALKDSSTPKTIHYELAQTYYAINELDLAKKNFEICVNQKIHEAQSLYYIGSINQLLEDHKNAAAIFLKISSNKNFDLKLRQVALFQASNSQIEMLSNISENKRQELVRTKIIPNLEKALNYDKTTPSAKDIEQTIIKIKREYGLDPNYLENGKLLTGHPYSLSLTNKLNYDSNVTSTNDDPSVIATQRDSYINTLDLSGDYRFVWKRSIILRPELGLTSVYHTNRYDSSVYTNDRLDLNAQGVIAYEHIVNSLPATFEFKVQKDHSLRDINAKNDLKTQTQGIKLTLSEQFSNELHTSYTWQYSLKKITGYLESLNGLDHSLSLSLLTPVNEKSLLLTLISLDLVRRDDESSNSNTITARIEHILPRFFLNYDFNYSLSTSFNDPIEMRDERGLEKTISGALTITKTISSTFKVSSNYTYTKNISKDEDSYSYSKNEISISLMFNW